MDQFIVSTDKLNSIIENSFNQPQFVFKHSNRCSISSMALNRVENNVELFEKSGNLFFIDVIQHRSVSNRVEEVLNIQHESPQLLVIVDGKCILSQSHNSIKPALAIEFLQSA